MKKSLFLLPSLAVGAAFVLLAPAQDVHGFTTLGGTLNVNQRDWRVFDNFADGATNNNTTPIFNFPGWQGAEQALWKAATEWASRPHADGTGDPTQAVLGNGSGNFDFVFSGAATSAGGINSNIVSAIPTCGGGGTFAYVQSPINDGWTMKFCDEWTWSDGPGGPGGGQIDLQGVGTHEFGHSLGLGHSNVNGATMIGGTFNGFEQRTINFDDVAGVQFLYGAVDSDKVEITAVSVDVPGGTMTINGNNFTADNNQVWFTNPNATAPNVEPRVIIVGLESPSGTEITLSIPPNAGDGDVHVRANTSGPGSVSNGWPVDLDGTGGPAINITSVTPPTVESLIPGIAQTVTLEGSPFTSSTTVTVDGQLLDPSSFTLVDSTHITLDMPQVGSLGMIDIDLADGPVTGSIQIEVVAPTGPVLQMGNGEPLQSNVVNSSQGLDTIFAGPPGELHYVLWSTSNAPSTISIVSLCIGNSFTDLNELTNGLVGPAGYTQINFPLPPIFGAFYFQDLSFSQGKPIPTSNCQGVAIVP